MRSPKSWFAKSFRRRSPAIVQTRTVGLLGERPNEYNAEASTCTPTTTMFQHSPLDTKKHHIRLLRLLQTTDTEGPGSHESVRCQLDTFEFDLAPRYLALSYTWGSPANLRKIAINGDLFEVRENLFDFLKQYQDHPANKEYLWIDQLCIDQTNVAERNNQVKFMSKIYKRCLRAVVWLDKSSHADAYNYKTRTGMPEGGNLHPLLLNPYFSRIWIVQEVLLAPEVHLLCGAIWINWDQLGDTARSFRYSEGRALQHLEYLWYTSTKKHLSGKLRDVLLRFIHNECQDPRDKVYGLLSLATDGNLIEVDYNRPISDVFLSTIATISAHTWPARSETLEYITWEDLGRLPRLFSELAEAMKLVKTEDAQGSSRLKGFFEEVLDIEYQKFQQCTEALPRSSSLAISFDKEREQFWYEFDGQRRYSAESVPSRGSPTAFRIDHDRYFENLRRSTPATRVNLDIDLFWGAPPSEGELISILQEVQSQSRRG